VEKVAWQMKDFTGVLEKEGEMKQILILLVTGLSLAVSIPAIAAYCPNSDYNIFLSGQGDSAPADLINEFAYETKTQKFGLSYDLVNLTPDILRARIELYRYLDEDGPNGGWKLEQTYSLIRPFTETMPIAFSGLQKGKTYSINLVITTDMPNISLEDGTPPIDISLKTVYFIWPKEHGMHVSATDSFEGEPRRAHLKIKWSSAAGSVKIRMAMKHTGNADNPVLESVSSGERSFSREEVWNWPSENLSSISLDAIDAGGTTIGTASLIIGWKPPCLDCQIVPCTPPPSMPPDPEASSENDKFLIDQRAKAVISYKYGGAFWALRLSSFSDSNNKAYNLVNNTGKQRENGTRYGIDGLLCQTAVVRKNEQWPNGDNTISTLEQWENDADGSYTPPCMDGQSDPAIKAKFHWNPSQGGPQEGFNTSCNMGTDNQDRWNGVLIKNHLGQTVFYKTVAPYYVDPSKNYTENGNDYFYSPVRYVTLFDHWLPQDLLPGAGDLDQYNYQVQPQVAMDATVSLIPEDCNNSTGIKIASRLILHSDCSADGNCHVTDMAYTNPNTGEKSYSFGAAIQDWAFFGGDQIQKAYYFEPTFTGNCFGIKERPSCPNADPNCLCPNGDNSCLQTKGWRYDKNNPLSYVDDNWVPYAIMSSEDKQAWVVIYNGGEDSTLADQPKIRRFVQSAADSEKGVNGITTIPFSRMDRLSDAMGKVDTTVIFIGPTLESVMCHLGNYTNWLYPKLTNPNCGVCYGTPPCSYQIITP